MASGRIIQFNRVRGYGFIEPDGGGEDVFIHCNELGDSATVARPGMRVEFNVLKGDRGLKASDVVLIDSPPVRPTTPAPAPGTAVDHEVLLDVMSHAEYGGEITNVLLDVLSSITASEIVEIRRRLVTAAAQRGWLEG